MPVLLSSMLSRYQIQILMRQLPILKLIVSWSPFPYIAARTYCLRYLRLKCADPGVGRTVTVKLYERWNDAIAQLIDSFDITPDNSATYHSLIDMFGVPEIHSDAILIRAVHDGVSPGDDVAIEVTYRHAVATT